MNNQNQNPNQPSSDAKWAKYVELAGEYDFSPDHSDQLHPQDATDSRLDELEVDSLLRHIGQQTDLVVDSDEFAAQTLTRIAAAQPTSFRQGPLPVPPPPGFQTPVVPANDQATKSENQVESNNGQLAHISFHPALLAIALTLLAGVSVFTITQFRSSDSLADNREASTPDYPSERAAPNTMESSSLGSLPTNSLSSAAQSRSVESGQSPSVVRNEYDISRDGEYIPNPVAQASNKVTVSVPNLNNEPDSASPVVEVLPEIGVVEPSIADADIADVDRADERAFPWTNDNDDADDAPPTIHFPGHPSGDWQLVINFNRQGIGAVSLNGEDLFSSIVKANARMLLHEIGIEAVRQVKFLQPRLGEPVSGSITINNKTIVFEDVRSIQPAFSAAVNQIDSMKFDDFDARSAVYFYDERRAIANPDLISVTRAVRKNSLQVLASKPSLRFALADEVSLLTRVAGRTTQILRELAKEKLVAEKNGVTFESTEVSEHGVRTISDKQFKTFTQTGFLGLPLEFAPREQVRIQHLSEEDLRSSLHESTISFDIFRTPSEEASAKNFVAINGQRAVQRSASLVAERNRLSRKIEKAKWKRSWRGGDSNTVAELKREQEALEQEIRKRSGEPLEPLKEILPIRIDLQGLPLVMGDECHLNLKDAKTMDSVSKLVGVTLGEYDRFASRSNSQNIYPRYILLMQQIAKSVELDNQGHSLSTLDQMFQIDHPRLRLELIEILRTTKSKAALDLIVRRAKFDMEPEVRATATEALRCFDIRDVRKQLVEGLDYPWHVVAKHSAESLVQLNDQEAIPELIERLDDQDPRIPVERSDGSFVQHELVAINHLRNCLLCHAPSTSLVDSGRALSPKRNEPLPVLYYQSTSTDHAFVRADVTYLRQDFSVIQPVEDHGPWPAEQRFDYVVQNKELTPLEAETIIDALMNEENGNQAAIVFALEKLTGKVVANNSPESWREVLESLN